MVLDLKGKVDIRPAKSQGDGSSQSAHPGSLLYPGERLVVPVDGSVTVAVLGLGVRQCLKPGSEATVGPAGCTPPESVLERIPQKIAVTSTLKRIRPAPNDSRNAGLLVRGADSDLPDPAPAVTPMFGATVSSDRPSLAWQPINSTKRYRIRLKSAAGRELWHADTDLPRMTYPKDEEALKPGYVYDWEVADTEGRTLARSRLSVALEIQRPRFEELKVLAEGDDRAGVFEAALGYAHLHAWDEALATYEHLVKLAPDEPAHRRALAELLHHAGRPDGAEAIEPSNRRGR
jgi:hypothetical protein